MFGTGAGACIATPGHRIVMPASRFGFVWPNGANRQDAKDAKGWASGSRSECRPALCALPLERTPPVLSLRLRKSSGISESDFCAAGLALPKWQAIIL